MVIEIPSDYKNEDIKHVRLGKWNEYGRYEKNSNGELKLVEKKEAPFSEYEKLISEGWKSLAKVPIDSKWTDGLSYSSPILKKHIEKDYNYGTIGGFNNLIFIDVDNVDLISITDEFFKDTKLIKTWSGKRHAVLRSDFGENKRLGCGIEIRSKNMQCVGVGSRGPNGEYYEDTNKKYFAWYPKNKIQQFINLVQNYKPNSNNRTFVVGENLDLSHSGEEYREILKLLKENKSKEEIFKHMENPKFEKWNTHGAKYEDYRERTYNRANEFLIKTKQPTQTDFINGGLKFWTIKDYEEYKPSKDYIIEGVMYPQENEMIYGQSGHFKSLDMLYRAICIASGRKYLGKFKIKKCPVAILSAENHKRVDKVRIKAIMRGLNLRKKDLPLYLLPREQCGDLLDKSFKAQVESFIIEKQIKVLFMDTINPLTPEIDDNKGKDVIRVFKEFIDPLIDSYNLTVVFLHHTDKQAKSFLGSTKFKANSDVTSMIDREDYGRYKIYNEKNREGEIGALEIGVEFINNNKGETKEIRFSLIKVTDQKGIKKIKRRTKEDIIEDKILTIASNATKTRKCFISYCQNVGSSATVDRVLKKLLAQRKLNKTNEGYIKVNQEASSL